MGKGSYSTQSLHSNEVQSQGLVGLQHIDREVSFRPPSCLKHKNLSTTSNISVEERTEYTES